MKIKENLVSTRVNGEDVIHDKNIRIDRLVAQIFGYSFTNVKVSDKGREREINLIKSPRRILRQCLEIQTLVIKKIEGSKRRHIDMVFSQS